MMPTLFERIQVAMLCDLAKPPSQRVLDFDFIQRAVANDDIWALSKKFAPFDRSLPVPPEVELVEDKLTMWETIEDAYERLDEVGKERVKAEAYMPGGSIFPGFFGRPRTRELDADLFWVDNTEMHIAEIFVHDLRRFEKFRSEGRLIARNPGSPGTYDRMLDAWRPRHDKLKHERLSSKRWDMRFSADEIIQIVRERVEPSMRQVKADGSWTTYRNFDVDAMIRVD